MLLQAFREAAATAAILRMTRNAGAQLSTPEKLYPATLGFNLWFRYAAAVKPRVAKSYLKLR